MLFLLSFQPWRGRKCCIALSVQPGSWPARRFSTQAPRKLHASPGGPTRSVVARLAWPGARACLIKFQCPMNDLGLVDSSDHALPWRRRAPAKNETSAHASPRKPHARDHASHGNGQFRKHRLRNSAQVSKARVNNKGCASV